MADREKVINALKDYEPYAREFDSLSVYGWIVLDALALLKEQEPKTGYWIDSAGDDKCSVCGATYSDLYPDYQHTHYCPNCGAKMIIQRVEEKSC